MSRSVGDEIPEAVRRLLAGDRLGELEGLTLHLLTVTEEGWPHVALLSVGEVVCLGPAALRLALWPGSTSTGNLARTGKATIALVHDGVAYALRCRASRGPELDVATDHGALASFELALVEALADVVVYAELTSGVTFRLLEPEPVRARWHATIAALLRQPPAG